MNFLKNLENETNMVWDFCAIYSLMLTTII